MTELELIISDTLAALLPTTKKDADRELEQLRANLIADGRAVDPILYWRSPESQNIVVDGMRRLPILRELDLPYETKLVNVGTTWEEAEEWVLTHQLGRRNLSTEAIGKLYNRLKKRRKGNGSKELQPRVSNDTQGGKTATRIAKATGKSESTVIRAGKRQETLERCEPAVQKGVEEESFTLSDADVQTLSKLSAADQNAIATALRKKQTGSVKEYMTDNKIKAPGKQRRSTKQPKKPNRAALCKEFDKLVDATIKCAEKVGKAIDEDGCARQTTILDYLENAKEEMKVWMQNE